MLMGWADSYAERFCEHLYIEQSYLVARNIWRIRSEKQTICIKSTHEGNLHLALR